MSTIILDTVDRIYPLCMDYVCKMNGMQHPSDEGYGKGWAAVRNEWNRVHQKLIMQDCAVVYIAHSTERKIMRKHREIDITQPDIPKTGLGLLHDLSDMILYMGYNDNDERRLYGMPKEDLMVGCRGGIIIDAAEPSFATIDEAIQAAQEKTFSEIAPTILIYGPPKIGKSTLAASFPDPIVIDMENGYKFLDVPEKHLCSDWEQFLAICKNIFNNDKEGGKE